MRAHDVRLGGRDLGGLFLRVDALFVLAALVDLAFCFRGQGAPFGWLVLAVLPPALRLLLSPAYRERVGAFQEAFRFRES